LYFSAEDGVHGRELWSYDGSQARLVLDLNPGPYGSGVSELTVYNGSLYFSADDGSVPGLSTLEPRLFALALEAPLRCFPPQISAGQGLTLTLGNADESPVTINQLARIQVQASADLRTPLDQWETIPNSLVLTNGLVQVTGLDVTNAPARFFRAVLAP
jgi:ELWxxDGT repeat protein